MNDVLQLKLKDLICSHQIMLFMKGHPNKPLCRFSAHIVSLLETVKKPYGHFNILEDFTVREGLKEYSQWPTFPQLYFQGQLIGGDDIISEMFESGNLEKALT